MTPATLRALRDASDRIVSSDYQGDKLVVPSDERLESEDSTELLEKMSSDVL